MKGTGTNLKTITNNIEIAKKYRGIIKDEAIKKTAYDRVKKDAKDFGFSILGETESPIEGGDGNKEFLLYLKK